MPRTLKTASYICSACNSHFSTWSGRCSECGEWNTLEIQSNYAPTSSKRLKTEQLSLGASSKQKRLIIGVDSLDQVFGGGIVEGSVVLVSGEPGMGKSTLLLQLASQVAKQNQVLYVSGEESVYQISLRASRLGLKPQHLKVATSNSTDDIASEIASNSYALVVVDSIQTLRADEIGASAGSISQVTNSAGLLTQVAKNSSTALVIVGHVTKEGNIAGPKLLEHIVDVVLSLEGEKSMGLKLLRATKNRYGSTSETAIFEMQDTGLIPVTNPSAVLLEERKITDGSIVLATIEGSRPILVEVQALVNPTSYGYPKRAASGFDLSRLNLLVAVLERRTSLKLADKDVYLNIVGGLKITEPAADLAIAMAIGSAARGKRLKDNAVVFGEVGLSGEVRHVPHIDKRLAEAKSLGFVYAIGPKITKLSKDNFLKPATDVRQALNTFLE